jgi:hypothetical protein
MRQRYQAPIPRQIALRRRAITAAPGMRARIREIQAELLDELHRLDAAAQDLVWRRQAVVTELGRCRDALGHAGTHWKRDPLPADVDTEPEGTIDIRGQDLRHAVTAVMRAAGAPVDVGQIHRMLLAHGRRPAGRPSQAISNALRAELAKGRVVRLDRGVYAWSTDG